MVHSKSLKKYLKETLKNNHQNAVFIFMSPNDISKLEQDLINLKETE